MSIEPHKPIPWPVHVQPSNRSYILDKDGLLVNAYQEKMANGDIHTIKRPCFVPWVGATGGVIGLGKGAHQRLFTSNVTVYRVTDGATLGAMGGSDHIAPCTYADLDFASTDTFINGGFLGGNNFHIAGASALTVISGPQTNDAGPYAPGVVWLNGTVYVMTYAGRIYGSNVGVYTTWAAGNVISTNVNASLGMALAKQKVYVIAFSRFAVTVFYDAGNASGSPLSLLPGGQSSIGLYDHNTLQSIGDDLYWVGTPSTVSLGVYKMSDLKITKISTPAVDRILMLSQYTTYPYIAGSFTGANPATRSLSLATFGHRYYVLNLYSVGYSLVYDTDMGIWYIWQTAGGQALPYFTPLTYGGNLSTESYAAIAVPELSRFQGSNGALYAFNPVLYSDVDGVPQVRIVTDNFDAGTSVKKVFKRFDFMADQAPGSFMSIQHTEDDYQSWSALRTIDLNVKHPHLLNLGTFRRRAYRMYHQSNTPFRLRGAMAHLMPGSI
jgi:hypothetical protein